MLMAAAVCLSGGQAQGEVAAAARKQLETAGGGNSDFATLLAVFQRCNNRYGVQLG